jgi:hypothetical protein
MLDTAAAGMTSFCHSRHHAFAMFGWKSRDDQPIEELFRANGARSLKEVSKFIFFFNPLPQSQFGLSG